MSLIVLTQTDSGPYHKNLFLQIQYDDSSLFILVNIDIMLMILLCPKLSFLRIIDWAMSILNIGLVGLPVWSDKNLLQWFTYILCKSNSMAQILHDVDEYENILLLLFSLCSITKKLQISLQKKLWLVILRQMRPHKTSTLMVWLHGELENILTIIKWVYPL